jgi:hypothetical protein
VVEAVACYQDFVAFAHKHSSDPVLPLLYDIQHTSVRLALRGHGVVGHLRFAPPCVSNNSLYGMHGARQEETAQMGREALEQLIMARGGRRKAAASAEIEWSDLGGGSATDVPAEIDWGAAADGGGGAEAAAIDWDLGGAADPAEGNLHTLHCVCNCNAIGLARETESARIASFLPWGCGFSFDRRRGDRLGDRRRGGGWRRGGGGDRLGDRREWGDDVPRRTKLS